MCWLNVEIDLELRRACCWFALLSKMSGFSSLVWCLKQLIRFNRPDLACNSALCCLENKKIYELNCNLSPKSSIKYYNSAACCCSRLSNTLKLPLRSFIESGLRAPPSSSNWILNLIESFDNYSKSPEFVFKQKKKVIKVLNFYKCQSLTKFLNANQKCVFKLL